MVHRKTHNRLLAALVPTLCLAAAPDLRADTPTPDTATAHEVDQDLMFARMGFGARPANVVMLRSMDRLFQDLGQVSPGRRTTPLPTSQEPLKTLEYSYENTTYNFADYLARTHTNALVVLKNGEIVSEAYRNGADADSQFAVFSISKSLVSLLIGVAIDRGEIASVEDRITVYASEYAGTGYEGVTIRDALRMRSGVAFNEEGADMGVYFEQVIAGNKQRCGDFIKPYESAHRPGEQFNYSSPETCVLARVLERASGLPLHEYTEKFLWHPGGMTSPAFWVLDGPKGVGTAIANGGFNSTARDLARVGQIMLDNGRASRREIVSADWAAASTATDGDPTKPQDEGYGYQWWTRGAPASYAGLGFNGQFLYVVPSESIVIVKFSYWPVGWDDKLEAETTAGFQAIIEALK